MATAYAPLQAALMSALNARAPLVALVNGIYDEVPESAERPYVSLGSLTATPDDMHDAQGVTVLVQVDIWSEYEGYREAYQIFAEVDAALDRAPLAVAGWTYVTAKLDQSQALRDPDPAVRRVSATYRITLTKEG